MKGQVSIWVIILFSRAIRENHGNILWISICHHMALQNDKQKQYIYFVKEANCKQFKRLFYKTSLWYSIQGTCGIFCCAHQCAGAERFKSWIFSTFFFFCCLNLLIVSAIFISNEKYVRYLQPYGLNLPKYLVKKQNKGTPIQRLSTQPY